MNQVKMGSHLNMYDIRPIDVTMHSYTLIFFFSLTRICKGMLLPEGGIKMLLIVTCDNQFKIK